MRAVPAVAVALALVPGATQAQRGPKVSIVTPPLGNTVAGPKVLVELQVDGFRLVEAGSRAARGEGHAHLFVNRPVGTGRTIPTDVPGIVHLGRPPFSGRVLELANGEHTVAVRLGDSAHRGLGAVARTIFHVAPGFRGKGALEPACAEVATGTGEVRLSLANVGGAVQGAVNTRCEFKTEGGACSWAAVSNRRMLGSYDARTKAVTGQAYGTSERRLESGATARCGRNELSPLPPEGFTATVQGDSVSGGLGEARFTLRPDPAVVIDAFDPPGVRAPRPAGATAPAPDRGGGSPLPWALLAVAGFAALAAGSVALRRRRVAPLGPGRPSAEVTAPRPVAPVAATPAGPRSDETLRFCEQCGAERRPGSRFCAHCGVAF